MESLPREASRNINQPWGSAMGGHFIRFLILNYWIGYIAESTCKIDCDVAEDVLKAGWQQRSCACLNRPYLETFVQSHAGKGLFLILNGLFFSAHFLLILSN